jgi:hypothetical protein
MAEREEYSEPIFEEPVRKVLERLSSWHSEDEREYFRTMPWRAASIMAYWYCPLETVDLWISILCRRDRGVVDKLEEAMEFMPFMVFHRFFPLRLFAAEWPYMRIWSPRKSFNRRAPHDLIWSLAVSGHRHVPPLPGWFELTPAQRDFLVLVLKNRGRNAEEYAALAGRPVADAGADLARLTELKFLRSDGEGRHFRDDSFVKYQFPRKVETKRYWRKDGTIYTSTNRPDY